MLPVIDQFIFEVDPNNTYIKIKISINLNAVSKINIRTIETIKMIWILDIDLISGLYKMSIFIALQCYLVNRNSFWWLVI